MAVVWKVFHCDRTLKVQHMCKMSGRSHKIAKVKETSEKEIAIQLRGKWWKAFKNLLFLFEQKIFSLGSSILGHPATEMFCPFSLFPLSFFCKIASTEQWGVCSNLVQVTVGFSFFLEWIQIDIIISAYDRSLLGLWGLLIRQTLRQALQVKTNSSIIKNIWSFETSAIDTVFSNLCKNIVTL